MQENKKHALDLALAQIEKSFGKGAIMKFSQDVVEHVPIIKTGSLSLDLALGVGGFPIGRIIEIYGPESSGKTTLAMHAIAQAQKANQICAFIDAEHAMDIVYAAKLGVDTKNLLISQPDTGEQALEIVDSLVSCGAVGLIVVDSVAALVPKAEIEGEMGDSHMGLQARLMSQALRKLTSTAKKNDCTIIFINQLRSKIGVLFGSPEVTTGGNALKFYASVRIDIRKTGVIKKGDNIIGNEVKIKVVKNKVSPPFKEVDVEIYFGQGISFINDLINISVGKGLLNKSGSWYSYKEQKIGQGKDSVRDFFASNPLLMEEIEQSIRAGGLSG